MKLGVCAQISEHEAAQKAGFDYIEPAVEDLVPSRPEAEFVNVQKIVAAAGIKPEAFNCFIPGELKITGPDADLHALKEHVTIVCNRAQRVGADVIVFGSGGSRAVPEGFAVDEAMEQVAVFLDAIAPIAADSGITIAVEPLRKAECNIINLVKEGYEVARNASHPAIRGLADLYHVGQENEPYENIIDGGELLAHVHIAHPGHRKCPLPDDGFDYKPFFRALKQADYNDRISVESSWDNLAEQGPVVADYLRAEWGQA